MENTASATVNVSLLNTAAQDVSTQNIQVNDTPSGYTVRLRTRQISGIHLYGPAAQMTSPPAVTASVDMASALNGTGQYAVPVQIQAPSGFWTTGNYTAVVSVSRS